MEILKKGTLPAEREYVKTCSTCGTEFKFLHKESRPGGFRDENYRYVTCPLCKQSLSFKP